MLISEGRVTVNGAVVSKLGSTVEQRDVVAVDGMIVKPTNKMLYIAVNKPMRYLSSVSDDRGRATVIDLINNEITERMYPIGRLDYDSHGLLLMTNDGDFAQKLAHPSNKIKKTYIAALKKPITNHALKALQHGVKLEDGMTRPAEVDIISEREIRITIVEGKNRQIRRMLEAVDNKVADLERISIGGILLGNIPLGRWRHLGKTEVDSISRQAE